MITSGRFTESKGQLPLSRAGMSCPLVWDIVGKMIKKLLSIFLLGSFLCLPVYASGIDSFAMLVDHMDGADTSTTFTDSSTAGVDSPRAMTANGDAQVDTAQSKFGGASCLLDGTVDSVSAADSEDWNFGTADFTVDFWMRMNANSADVRAFEIGDSDTDGVHWNANDGANNCKMRINGNTITRAFTFSTNTWYHIEINRNGTDTRIFVDGTQLVGLGSNASNITSGTQGIYIGNDTGGGLAFNGWIDEFRVSKGIARHTSDFTPETAAYSAASATHRFFQVINE